MKVWKYAAAMPLLLLALVGSFMCALALVDPVGTKLSDDSDPFGTPPGRIVSCAILLGFIAVGGAGLYVLRKPH
jgi:hypothetical protein